MAESNQRVKLKRGKASTVESTAKEAGSILIETDTGIAYVDNSDIERVQLKDPTKVSKDGDTMNGDLDMGDNHIILTAEPDLDEDVVNKKYVDEHTKDYKGIDPIIVDSDSAEISHKEYGNLSGGPDDDMTLEYGESVPLPTITTNTTGHVTKIEQHKITMPDFPSKVREAEYADEADHATEADHADKADIATNADSADEADKLANTRTIDGVEFDGTYDVAHYGTCTTANGTAAKVVACDRFVLDTGAEITVRFSQTNSADSPTLNVESTGAKEIRYNNSALTGSTIGYIKANHVYRFVYDGTYYNIVGDIDTDTEQIEYTGTAPIEIDNDSHIISHEDYGENEVGPEADTSLKFGGTFTVPYVLTNATGHVIDANTYTMTMPEAPDAGHVYTADYPINITDDDVIQHESYDSISVGPESDEFVDFGGSFIVPSITSDVYGHVSAGENRTITLPSEFDGNAASATKLENAVNLDGIDFDGSEDVLHYGECTTDGDNDEKTVECENYEAIEGAYIQVYFENDNTADDVTLNVNDTGSKAITLHGNPITSSMIQGGGVYTFVLSQGCYELISGGGQLYRTDSVEDTQVEFRNITIIEHDEDPEDVEAPAGSIILQRGASRYCLLSVIADEFSTSKSYSSGDYCVYDNTLYKFTSSKSAGNWDSSKVTATTVMEEIQSGIQAYNLSTASITALQERVEDDETKIQTLQSHIEEQDTTIHTMQESIEELTDQIKATLDPGDIDTAPGPADDDNGDDDNGDDGGDGDDDTASKEEPGIVIPDDGDNPTSEPDNDNPDDEEPDHDDEPDKEDPEPDGGDDGDDDGDSDDGDSDDGNNEPDEENPDDEKPDENPDDEEPDEEPDEEEPDNGDDGDSDDGDGGDSDDGDGDSNTGTLEPGEIIPDDGGNNDTNDDTDTTD